MPDIFIGDDKVLQSGGFYLYPKNRAGNMDEALSRPDDFKNGRAFYGISAADSSVMDLGADQRHAYMEARVNELVRLRQSGATTTVLVGPVIDTQDSNERRKLVAFTKELHEAVEARRKGENFDKNEFAYIDLEIIRSYTPTAKDLAYKRGPKEEQEIISRIAGGRLAATGERFPIIPCMPAAERIAHNREVEKNILKDIAEVDKKYPIHLPAAEMAKINKRYPLNPSPPVEKIKEAKSKPPAPAPAAPPIPAQQNRQSYTILAPLKGLSADRFAQIQAVLMCAGKPTATQEEMASYNDQIRETLKGLGRQFTPDQEAKLSNNSADDKLLVSVTREYAIEVHKAQKAAGIYQDGIAGKKSFDRLTKLSPPT